MIAGPRATVTQASGQGINLDAPPPSPPARHPSLQQLAGGSELGAEAGNPQIKVLEGLRMVESGAQLLAGGLPGMATQLAELVAGLRQAVPEQMAQMTQGAPGVMPATQPPPGAM